MAGIQVVADSACDLPDEILGEFGIDVVPLTICFGDEEYVDRRTLSPAEFWKLCSDSRVLPTTAAPAPGAFLDAFERARDAGKDGVVCVTMSSGISGTYQSAVKASEMLDCEFPVEVVDCRSITVAEGLVVLAAARAALDAAPLDTVVSVARSAIERLRGFVALDTLDNLKKGGRIGAAQALFGSALSVKPIIKMEDGVVVGESRQRTRGRALDYLVKTTKALGEVEILGVTHGDASDLDEFLRMVAGGFPDVEIVVSQMGAVLGAHVGEGAVCLATLVR
ncbi:MAG: DegV family protein [Acidimicrobiales bacterium]